MRKWKLPIIACMIVLCALTCTACGQGQGAQQQGSSASAASDPTSEPASGLSSSPAPAPAPAPTSSSASEPATFSEGVDTPCEATYAPYEGSHPELFLKQGDKIAVISPSALPTREQVDATMKGLAGWGYVPVEGKHVCEEDRTLDDCLADLEWALSDPSIKAIFCVRGGYGVSEVADKLDLDLVKSANKLIIGYSDITVLHAVWTTVGLPSIHACMSAAFDSLDEKCDEAEKNIMAGEIPAYTCAGSPYDKAGEGEGVLIGGNLSTYTAVVGAAYDSSKIDGPYVLFLEDIGEDVQHIHRYLTVLKHTGVLDNAAGIVFGEWIDTPVDMDDYPGDSRGGTFTSVADMIAREFLSDIDAPVAFGFPAGHGDVNYPLLMGEKVHLSVTSDGYSLSW